ncbi:MAG: MBL fold metallo-hydrolase [Candidatus Aramenus sulfurataquae]|jgi:7,8-dihydropterin-6-yl-methyl-4-(beta-D-ribofuranosyl)aminobenzene 5'-phosphate synthase|uniref:Beta-lactamase n=2 Tax=Candidatus Aramenus sulfurataquae TaxID=1326980 RepID=A0A0F2LM25_9CREN|nr:MBL fold metallo-hydrolase [Candidatus Aramenus sulfurataquae]
MGSVSRLAITVLSDNFSSTIIPPLLGEWGFSAYIETEKVKVLYDVGNSGIPVLRNAEKLGIDLSKVDYVVLSHGHLDHTGGLANEELREKIRGKVVVAHPSIFERKFLNWRNKLEYIGIPLSKEEMEREFRLLLTREPLEIAEGVYFSGEVKNYNFPRYTKGLFKASDERLAPDELKDDAALYVNIAGKGVVAITGCGHSGVLNIAKHAIEVTKADKVHAIVGGLHLLASTREEVEGVMASLNVEKIAPAHCSGNLAKVLAGERYLDAGVGATLRF